MGKVRKKIGRPGIGINPNRHGYIFRLNDSRNVQLNEESRATGKSKSDIVDTALGMYFNDKPRGNHE